MVVVDWEEGALPSESVVWSINNHHLSLLVIVIVGVEVEGDPSKREGVSIYVSR